MQLKNGPTRRTFCRSALAAMSLGTAVAGKPAFRVLGLYSTAVEKDHADFGAAAVKFFAELAAKHHFEFEPSTDWDKLSAPSLNDYQVVVWLNNIPATLEQKIGFERYMRGGGGWLGFHVAGYTDSTTHWPWMVELLGGGMFAANNWPPQPARLYVNEAKHPVTRRLPREFNSPPNEWYQFRPSPRLNRDVQVLVTLEASNYPLGTKDVLTTGDLPVVWTHTQYNMLYCNLGHDSRAFSDQTQNLLFEDAMLWLGRRKK